MAVGGNAVTGKDSERAVWERLRAGGRGVWPGRGSDAPVVVGTIVK